MSTTEAPSAIYVPRVSLSTEQFAYAIAALVIGTGASMTTFFGLPGLAMTALTLVPIVFVALILITVGK